MVNIVTGRVSFGNGEPAWIASREAEAKAYNPECRTRKASAEEINAMLESMGITEKPKGKRKLVGVTSWKKTSKEKHMSMDEVIAQDQKRIKELESEMEKKKAETKHEPVYPQAEEDDEYRYFDWDWIDDVAKGLTRGARKHPGETWHDIPAKEHVARIARHCVKYLKGDESENHLIHIAMRCMMAYRMDKIEHEE